MPRRGSEVVDIDCHVVYETDRAYKINTADKIGVWVPKSQVDWDPDRRVMTMSASLAEEKELV